MSQQEINQLQNQLGEYYKYANKLHYEIDAQINEIYNGKEQSKDVNIVIDCIRSRIGDLETMMRQIEENLASYHNLIRGNESMNNSYLVWRTKIDRLKNSVMSHSINIDKAFRNYKKTQATAKRSSQNNVERRRIMEYQNEHESLDRSQGIAYEIERQGMGIIENLQKQQEILKKVKLRALQMLNTIGMSESILKLIEKRSRTDMLIFFGLAIFTIILIVILFYYVKPMLFGSAVQTVAQLQDTDYPIM
ncbi:UNKNOWN [Stylonychia lemnae]|uniref:Uncharacterized protein n=1 Tax=Stylonychia lemnae TaxID=5949 RepID=A0A078BAK5_STYLE|nr:UNKNOWN [Stylonychia lemnae]|eukprot:CDW91379.1 UNKNOWN [Stylonychia lemnae]